jgi:oligosaccharide:H+ symporter
MQQRLAWLKVRDLRSFLCMMGMMCCVYTAVGFWSPLMSVYTGKLGADLGQIGIVLATFQATSLASQYWWGRRSDRIGRRKPLLLIGTAGLAIAYLIIAFISSWQWIIPARMLEGLVLAAYNTSSLAMIGDLLEGNEHRGRLMGVYRMFGSLAFSIASLIGGSLADAYSIRLPFIIASGCYVLAFIIVSLIREQAPAKQQKAEQTQEAPQSEASAGISTVSQRALWSFMLLSFTWAFGMGAVASFWPYFMNSIGYTTAQVGQLWALTAMCEVVWLMVVGWIADRLGSKNVMIFGVMMMACIYFSYTLATSFLWFVLIQLVRAIAYSCFETPSLLYATELGLRQHRGRLAGLFYSATGIGGIIGAALGGRLADWIGMVGMYRSVVAFMLCVAVLLFFLMPNPRKVAPAH